MASKTGKKHIPAKTRSQNRRLAPSRGDANKRGAHQPAAPKPPQNGYLIWGRHAVFAALANNGRRVAQIYAASDDFEAELQSHLRTLPPERRNNLPPIQRIDRQRLESLAGPHDKAVHQGVAMAVWPLDPPHLDDFFGTTSKSTVKAVTSRPSV